MCLGTVTRQAARFLEAAGGRGAEHSSSLGNTGSQIRFSIHPLDLSPPVSDSYSLR